jgi:hypothetical protein
MFHPLLLHSQTCKCLSWTSMNNFYRVSILNLSPLILPSVLLNNFHLTMWTFLLSLFWCYMLESVSHINVCIYVSLIPCINIIPHFHTTRWQNTCPQLPFLKRRLVATQHTQWNLLKKNPVKKISCLRNHDKKAPKFSHFIKITLLRNFPLKK